MIVLMILLFLLIPIPTYASSVNTQNQAVIYETWSTGIIASVSPPRATGSNAGGSRDGGNQKGYGGWGSDRSKIIWKKNKVDSDDTITLTGKQIQQLALVNPENMTFIKNGIKLVVPTRLLKNRLTEDSDQFQVSMTLNGNDEFRILFYINGTSITDLDSSEFTVYIPWEGMTDGVSCYQTVNQQIPAAGYENGFLLFDLIKSGNYQMEKS